MAVRHFAVLILLYFSSVPTPLLFVDTAEGFAPAISNTAAMLALGRGGEKDEERAAK